MLAPMEGVTHPELRAVVAELGGVGMVCTEFVRVSRGPLARSSIRRMVVRHPAVPLSVQVMGNEAEKMAEAARIVCDAGADVVDVNLGCPMPRIVRQGVGAAMLKDRALLFDVLSRMRAATSKLLSAKIRAGLDDAAGVIDIARLVERAGADFIVVHPRRRCDFYEGVADWRIIGVLRRELRIPVVGNGDVWYAADALRMQAETGCDAVMIGRPALRNPWIFRQIEALRRGVTPERPSGEDVMSHVVAVTRRYERTMRRPLGPIKELIRFIGRALDDGRAFVVEALRAQSVCDLLRVCERHVAALPPESLDLDAFGALGLERSGSAGAAGEAA